jgi:HlyD family secretion protein
VAPGQAVLALADLSHLRVETVDLSERDVARVALGQPAIVYVEALGEEIEGRVVGISPQSTTIGGDVVYTVYVELGEQLPGLRWGMSADVEIATD